MISIAGQDGKTQIVKPLFKWLLFFPAIEIKG